jgi:hypothetical protein
MSQSILVFDFGTNEEAAQQARHKLETWKQAFRLGNKIALKFEREETEGTSGVAQESGDGKATDDADEKPASKSARGKNKAAAGKKKSTSAKSRVDEGAAKSGDGEPPARIHLLIKLDFSDHEKLTQQRWLDRIPSEEPFKSAKPEVVRHSDAAFAEASGRFDSLD